VYQGCKKFLLSGKQTFRFTERPDAHRFVAAMKQILEKWLTYNWPAQITGQHRLHGLLVTLTGPLIISDMPAISILTPPFRSCTAKSSFDNMFI
jgi:hypothetical protein